MKFEYGQWRIDRAVLLAPAKAILARAENDDYATGVFYPENPTRVMEGKAESKPQRFALEFFMKFRGEDRGQKAVFKVTFSRINNTRRSTMKVSPVVPFDTE